MKPQRPLRVAVVGHTNTGKTSLLRTLTRDTGFGEVSSRPSTTRHVEGARLLADGVVQVELFDTPGMEDPIGLLERLESLARAGDDGLARIERFLHEAENDTRFEQEAKVLRQLRASDAGLYVVDARDPVLAKHRDELTILGGCAVPLLPVLNFVHSPEADLAGWREALSRIGLHAQVRFDTVTPERDGERLLYEKLATLLDDFRPTLTALIAAREREAAARHQAALRLVADMLIDVAAMRDDVPARGNLPAQPSAMEAEGPNEAKGRAEAEEAGSAFHSAFHARVSVREQVCVEALLELYRFRPHDVDAAQLPLAAGRWEEDPFSPEALQRMGVRLGTGAAAGAAAGAGVDVLLGGTTLGAGAAIGALAGGGAQVLRQFGARLFGTEAPARGVDDGVLRLVALRQLHLVRALEARGHAAIEPVQQFAARVDELREGRLPRALRQARQHPEWLVQDSAARERARDALLADLREWGQT